MEAGYRKARVESRSPRMRTGSGVSCQLSPSPDSHNEHEAFARSLGDLRMPRFSHRPGPHHLVPIRGFHIDPTEREWGSGSRGWHGGGRWSLPSRLGSAGRRSVHTQWMREGCLEWRLEVPQLKEVFQAGAALQGRGTDKNGP